MKKSKIGFLMLNEEIIRTCGVFKIAKRMVKTNQDVGNNTNIAWKSHQRNFFECIEFEWNKNTLSEADKVVDAH